MRHNLKALQIFESVCRNKSYAKAAAELNITPSAISHQLRGLTGQMGEKLLNAAGGAIITTQKGEKLARSLTAAFTAIDDAVNECAGSKLPSVRLAVCSSFGPGVAIPNMAALLTAVPHLSLQLRMYVDDPVQTDAVADAFVTTRPFPDGYFSQKILDERNVVVHAPELHPGALFSDGVSLITTDIDHHNFATEWDAVYRDTVRPANASMLQCTHYVFAIEMARRGLGFAILPTFLVAEDVLNDTLRVVRGMSLPTDRSYYYGYKLGRDDDADLKALGCWLKNTCQNYVEHSIFANTSKQYALAAR